MGSRHLRPVAAALAALLLLAGCGGDDSGAAADERATTTTVAPTTGSDLTSTAGKALVVPTTIAPIVPSTTSTTVDTDLVALDELEVGDCIDIAGADGAEAEVGTARRRDCDEPHGLEIFHLGSLNDDPDAAYPGDDAVLAGADQMCLDAFEGYVGSEYVDSSLEIAHLRPDEAVWLAGDRVVRCAVQSRDLEPLVGSVAGSGR